jgi:hypothetical protein
MKKLILTSVVGGLLIFIWQFLSFGLLELHRPATDYTPKQTEILNYLNSQFTEDGGYFLPNVPKGTSGEEMEAAMKDAQGKPWAIISYHKTNDSSMTMNMIRGLLVNIVAVGLFCWLIGRMKLIGMGQYVLAGLITGFIIFLNEPYTLHIWYETFDLMASFADAIISWTMVGLIAGLFYRRREIA